MSRLIVRHPASRDASEATCRIHLSGGLAELVYEGIAEPMAEAVIDDFARMPESVRAEWRAKAAEFYGFPSYEWLREEALLDWGPA